MITPTTHCVIKEVETPKIGGEKKMKTKKQKKKTKRNLIKHVHNPGKIFNCNTTNTGKWE